MLERKGETISLLSQEELNKIFQDIEASWDEINSRKERQQQKEDGKDTDTTLSRQKKRSKTKKKFWRQLQKKISKIVQKIFNPKQGEYHKRMKTIKSQWVRSYICFESYQRIQHLRQTCLLGGGKPQGRWLSFSPSLSLTSISEQSRTKERRGLMMTGKMMSPRL